jgi:hypothetical protein
MPEPADLRRYDESLAAMMDKVRRIRVELCGEKVRTKRFWRKGGICNPLVHLVEYGEQLLVDDFPEYVGVI